MHRSPGLSWLCSPSSRPPTHTHRSPPAGLLHLLRHQQSAATANGLSFLSAAAAACAASRHPSAPFASSAASASSGAGGHCSGLLFLATAAWQRAQSYGPCSSSQCLIPPLRLLQVRQQLRPCSSSQCPNPGVFCSRPWRQSRNCNLLSTTILYALLFYSYEILAII